MNLATLEKRFDTCDMKGEDGEKYNHHYASNIHASNITSLAGSRMQRIIKVIYPFLF